MVVRSLIALIAGAALTVAALLGYYLGLGYYGQADAVRYNARQLQLVLGQGASESSGIVVRAADPRGFAQISGPMGRPLAAARLTELHWRIMGLRPDSRIELLWLDQRQQPHLLPLKHTTAGNGRQFLGNDPSWHGLITGIGLIIRAPITQPLTVQELVLRPALPDALALLRQLWRQWTAFESWHGYSINLSVVGDGPLVGPVPAVALWLAVSGLMYLLLGGRRSGRRLPAAFAGMLLVSWLVLDLHWQWVLGWRLIRSRDELAGKTQAQKLATYDSELFPLIRKIAQALPDTPARVFLISAKPDSYQTVRARYFLARHNVYDFGTQPPPPRFTRPGDYVLVLLPVQGVSYHRVPGQEALLWGKQTLPVRPVLAEHGVLLFQVRGGS